MLHAAGGGVLRAPLDQRLQRGRAVAVVVADVEPRARLAGNEVDGLVADIDRGEFQVRGIEVLAALVERRLQRGDQRDQPADRIVGAIGIGDVALTAQHHERAVERAAAAGLDGVADDFDIARLAENAVVECLAALGRPLQKLDRAVDGDALLVAGDQERERAVFRPAAIGREMIERGGDETGNAALHIDRAAAVKLVAGDFAGERRVMPGRFVAGRHHIGMAGEYEIGLPLADARVEIVDRRSAGLGKGRTLHA